MEATVDMKRVLQESFGGQKKRRKQSKPVRISSNDPHGEGESDGSEEGKVPEGVDNHLDVATRNQLVKTEFCSIEIPLNLSNGQKQESPTHPDIAPSSSIVDVNAKVGNYTSIQPTMEQDANQSLSKDIYVDGSLTLSSSASLHSNFILPFMTKISENATSLQVPQQSAYQSYSSATPIRIFNPDAYCELCNKEFCNKYFLRTHKANKHGIYIESPIISLGSKVVNGSSYTPLNSSSSTSNTPPATFLTQAQQTVTKSPSNATDIFTSAKSNSNGTMRAFCDICHKKFCNKYFVRRHKSKIHGINLTQCNLPTAPLLVSDAVIPQENENTNVPAAPCDVGTNGVDVNSPDVATLSQTEDQTIHDFEKHAKPFSPSKLSTDGSETTEQQRILKTESDNDVCDAREIDVMNISSSSQSNLRDSQGLSPNKLRKLGVINADAFCEICCKEYCNKYFLRTHKMKRHGILYPDVENKDGKSTWNNPCSFIQTSPLNLIIGEQRTNSADSFEKTRTNLSDSEDSECSICGRQFQNVYLMQMHRMYIHSEIQFSEKPSNTTFSDKTSDNELKGAPTMEQDQDSTIKDEEHFVQNAVNGRNNLGSKVNMNDDLHKLQSMILQLNNIESDVATTCSICNKDFENRYILRAHMMTEHGHISEVKAETVLDKTVLPDATPVVSNGRLAFCFLCKQDFLTNENLLRHEAEVHSNETNHSQEPVSQQAVRYCKETSESKELLEKLNTPTNTNQSTTEKRVTLTPTSSYCEICNKELCNKYFMKTHMQRMHGIEIENGAQIGGVICDICNKELCSKYFLKVHKQNTHGIIEESASNQSVRDPCETQSPFPSIDTENALKPSDLNDFNHRYFRYFTEVCPICSRRFRSTKWLKTHLLNEHGDAGLEKWKELECHYHNQIQLMKQVKIQTGTNTNNAEHSSPTLKIPFSWNNGTENNNIYSQANGQDHLNKNDVGSYRIISSLFGPTDSSDKTYQCSYCNFTTPNLVYLHVHERSHSGFASQAVPEPPKPLQCPVCFQNFLQADVFQHHILTHQFSGVVNSFFPLNTANAFTAQHTSFPNSVTISSEYSEQSESNERLKENTQECENKFAHLLEESAQGKSKYKCAKCLLSFKSAEQCLLHSKEKHDAREDGPSDPPSQSNENLTNTDLPANQFKCPKCDFSCLHLVVLKKHISKEHREEGSEAVYDVKEDVGEALKRKLHDTAKKAKVPAVYAVPQIQTASIGRFIMQPFHLKEPESESLAALKFVPSLVFLPVKEKLSKPMTVSFSLTPA